MAILAFFRVFQTFLKSLERFEIQVFILKMQKFIKKSDFGGRKRIQRLAEKDFSGHGKGALAIPAVLKATTNNLNTD